MAGVALSFCSLLLSQGFYVFIRAIQLISQHNDGAILVGSFPSSLACSPSPQGT
jgi:hypothetical protein